jgi:DNA modification methylase
MHGQPWVSPDDWADSVGRNTTASVEAQSRFLIKDCRIDELKLDPWNPRRHSAKQVKQLARSIKTFGFTVPALIDQDRNVIAGHGRIRACRELGWSHIPTITIDNLSQAKRRALMIADNRLAETAEWDERLLADQLKELSLSELDFNIEVTGFDIGEIELKISAPQPRRSLKDPADTDMLPSIISPISKPGDLWILGQHRVLCGSALEDAALGRLMGDDRAAMVFCTPLCPALGGDAAPGDSSSPMRPRAFGSSEFAGFLSRSLRHQATFCESGALLYVCVDRCHVAELLAGAEEAGAALLDLCVWARDRAEQGALYRNQHEFVFVFASGSGPPCPARHHSRPKRSNFWRYPEVKSASCKRALKPVALVADAILDATGKGDIILDGFLGSGTTLIAAEKSGRHCFGIEPDPALVDQTIRRWQKLTGEIARHASTGQAFDDLADEAEVTYAA